MEVKVGLRDLFPHGGLSKKGEPRGSRRPGDQQCVLGTDREGGQARLGLLRPFARLRAGACSPGDWESSRRASGQSLGCPT